MEAYEHKSLDQQGKQHTGIIHADNEKQARQILRNKELLPVQIKQVLQGSVANTNKKTTTQRIGLKKSELPLIIRQLSTLIKAGLPIDDALSTIMEQSDNHNSEKILSTIYAKVMEGQSLASAMRIFPKAFDELITTSIEAGEQSGNLDLILDRLAEYLESRDDMSKQSMTALIYPMILIFTAIAVVAGLMVYIVPKVIQIFQSTQVELPIATQALIAISAFLSHYGLFMLLLLILSITGFVLALRNSAFRAKWHQFLLKTPLVGTLIRTMQAARFTRTLGILSKSAVPIVPALSLSSKVINNEIIKHASEQVATMVREGSSLANAMKSTGQFPPMTIKLVDVGEQSGQLSDMLTRAANAQERDVDNKLSALINAIQPMAILFVGFMVLFIVLAMLLPIFQINTVLT
ncbi:MAG: type II secretion system inner membrane protein GspF [Proteobacteria bacterium]|nr:type II secretion system inner membrane protein GspF [Pseudomonadota bacterium]